MYCSYIFVIHHLSNWFDHSSFMYLFDLVFRNTLQENSALRCRRPAWWTSFWELHTSGLCPTHRFCAFRVEGSRIYHDYSYIYHLSFIIFLYHSLFMCLFSLFFRNVLIKTSALRCRRAAWWTSFWRWRTSVLYPSTGAESSGLELHLIHCLF